MSEVQFSPRVRKADRWSKVIALLIAMGVFAGSLWLTDEPQLSSITAAGVGIGARFYIPYWASLSVPADERVSIEEHPGAGNFHHGAAGVALMVGSLGTVGLMLLEQNTTVALLLGLPATGALYFLLTELLPRG